MLLKNGRGTLSIGMVLWKSSLIPRLSLSTQTTQLELGLGMRLMEEKGEFSAHRLAGVKEP